MKADIARKRASLPGSRPSLGAVLFMGSVLFVAGCNTKANNDPLAGGGGLAGSWISSDNVFTAEFRDGSFSSRANDTGETLSTGSYVVVSTSEVRLQWFGALSKQENSASCNRPSVDVLNCRDQAGRAFTLRKSASTV